MSEHGEAPAGGFAQFRLAPPTGDDPSVPAMYSNFAQATVSPNDLTIHFGWYAIPALDQPPTGVVDVPIRPLVKVTLPLNLVRGTINLLERQLEAWETSFGQENEANGEPEDES